MYIISLSYQCVIKDDLCFRIWSNIFLRNVRKSQSGNNVINVAVQFKSCD